MSGASPASSPRGVVVSLQWGSASATFDLPHTLAKLQQQQQHSEMEEDEAQGDELAPLWSEICSHFLEAAAEVQAGSYRLTYLDDDGEEVELSSALDLRSALQQAAAAPAPVLEVFVRDRINMEAEWERVSQEREEEDAEVASAEDSSPEPPAAPQPAAEEEAQAEPQHEQQPLPADPSLESQLIDAAPAPPTEAAQPPASSSSGWSLMGLLGRRSASPAASPSEAQAPAPADEPTAAAASPSQPAEREFWEMDSRELAELASGAADLGSLDSGANSIVSAMDELHGRNAWDSEVQTERALEILFGAMLQRAEQRLGVAVDLGSSSASSDAALSPSPSPALLAELKGIPFAVFEPVIAQFAEICARYAEQRRAEAKVAEEARLAALVAAMREKARLEEEAAAAAEAARLESVRLEQAKEARAREEEFHAQQEKLKQALREEQEQMDAMRQQMAAMQEQPQQGQEQEQAEAEAEAIRLQRELQSLEAFAAASSASSSQALEQPADDASLHAAPASEAPLSPASAVDPPSAAVPQLDSSIVLNPQPLPPSQFEAPQQHQQPVPPLESPPSPARAESPVSVPCPPLVPIPVAEPLQSHALSASQRFNQALSDLRSMGYTDDALNTYVLQKTGLDLGATLDWLATDEATGGELKREAHSMMQQQ